MRIVPSPIVLSRLSQALKQAESYSFLALQFLCAMIPFSLNMTALAHQVIGYYTSVCLCNSVYSFFESRVFSGSIAIIIQIWFKQIQMIVILYTLILMIYLIRHAQSIYNEAELELQKKLGQKYHETEEYLQIKFDLKFEDAPLNEVGLLQAKKCNQQMANIEVDLVIVSPMRRAIMTCFQVFKNHKSKPPIVVDPAFRQIFQSSNDIGSQLTLSSIEHPDFDYSLIEDKNTWYIHTINDLQYRQRLINNVNKVGKQQQHQTAKQQMVQLMKEVWKQRCNGKPQLKEKMLPSINNQKAKLKQLLKKYKSIAVVSHSQNIKSYIGYKPQNCQIVALEENKI